MAELLHESLTLQATRMAFFSILVGGTFFLVRSRMTKNIKAPIGSPSRRMVWDLRSASVVFGDRAWIMSNVLVNTQRFQLNHFSRLTLGRLTSSWQDSSSKGKILLAVGILFLMPNRRPGEPARPSANRAITRCQTLVVKTVRHYVGYVT